MSASPLPRFALALCTALLAPFSPCGFAHDAPGEYFFGSDPGCGLANPLPLTVPPPALADLGDLAIPLPASPGAGLVLGLRFRNAAGAWGPTTTRRVYLLKTSAVDSVETAWGGNFTVSGSSAVLSGDTLVLARPASAPGGATGNLLSVRARAGSQMGFPVLRQVSPVGGAALTRLSYAIDATPDPVSSPFVTLSPEHSLSAVPTPLVLGNLTLGFHALHLLVQDASGGRTDSVRFLHVTPSSVQTLTGLAYTFQKSGGTATSVAFAPLTASESPQDVVLSVPASLGPGDYTLVLGFANATGGFGSATSSASLTLLQSYANWATLKLPGRSSGDTAMLADPDGDQLVNLLEYAFGLDPLSADVQPPYTVVIGPRPGGTDPVATVIYRQREGGVGELGENYTADGLTYTVEASSDLQIWVPYTQTAVFKESSVRQTNGDGTETVTLTIGLDGVLVPNGRAFLRLNVTANP
jgi:hypothetical protein